MENLKFVQLQKENEKHYQLLESLMIPYHMELNAHKPDPMITEEFLRKITRSSLDMQGDPDRHLELCYSDNNLIGFLYGKVDHEDHRGHKKPGFGYIMELYVKPEYRRKGYGNALFRRIESLFAFDGAKRMYLNTGTQAGIAFWTGLGFSATDEIQPHNNMVIYEKDIDFSVDIFISDYLPKGYAEKITKFQWHKDDPNTANGLRQFLLGEKCESDCFNVIAVNRNEDIVGRLFCLQNRINPKLWYYGDLAVEPNYRRKKIASRMFEAALKRISELGGEKIRTYVEPENAASLNLQASLEFKECEYKLFDNLINDSQIMFERDVPLILSVIPATKNEARFVCMFYAQNKEPLHGKDISLEEWRDILSKPDPSEENFIVLKGDLPVAWFRINGLETDTAWLSMLAVCDKFKRQGIGSFTVRFTEDFAKRKGKSGVGIHTNVDNIAAQNLYKKLGYTITEESECTNGDGEKRQGLTFYRDHLEAIEMFIDGVNFHVGELHDFSFISKIGKVFNVFDAMDSGNICFGVENEGKRYFIKYAGARTQDYKGDISDAVIRLKSAVKVYEHLQHPYLIQLIDHYPTGNGYVAIFDWVNGEGLRSYWDYVGQAMWNHPQSPNYRFRHLPINKRIGAVDKIFAFHQHVIEHGYVPIDFYDGSLLYDFETDEIHICDIDFYRKMPVTNDMGKMWGSDRFMSPEEYEFGAPLDEVKTVYNMGAAAFELLCIPSKDSYNTDRSFEAWSATKALFDVAAKAVSHERSERYQTVSDLIMAWNTAKTVNNIVYKKLSPDDINENMLNSYNRYEEVTYDYTPQDGKYILEHKPYIVNWSIDRKHEVINKYLSSNVYSGVCVWGAYDDNKIVGFSAISNNRFGSKKQYIRLLLMHTAYEYRGKGIGKILFEKAISSARELQAEKLYITASSSLGTQNFYKAMGCIYAEEIVPELFEEEPKDVHMEYTLEK